MGWYFHHWCVCADPRCRSVAFLQAFIVQDTFIWSFVFLFLVSCVLCGIYNLLKLFSFFFVQDFWYGGQSFLVFIIMDALVREQSQSIINTCCLPGGTRGHFFRKKTHAGELFWLQRRGTENTFWSGDLTKYPQVKVVHIGFLMVDVLKV